MVARGSGKIIFTASLLSFQGGITVPGYAAAKGGVAQLVKALANDPVQLRRVWENVKQVMAPGALDALVKEMIYVAVSATNGCEYCTHSHTAGARKKGMTDAMFKELIAVVGMANETNKMVTGYQVEIDPQFKK